MTPASQYDASSLHTQKTPSVCSATSILLLMDTHFSGGKNCSWHANIFIRQQHYYHNYEFSIHLIDALTCTHLTFSGVDYNNRLSIMEMGFLTKSTLSLRMYICFYTEQHHILQLNIGMPGQTEPYGPRAVIQINRSVGSQTSKSEWKC